MEFDKCDFRQKHYYLFHCANSSNRVSCLHRARPESLTSASLFEELAVFSRSSLFMRTDYAQQSITTTTFLDNGP